MDNPTIVSLIGALIVLFLSINAYFLKGILQELSELKVTAARLLSDNIHTEKELERIDQELLTIREKLHAISNCVAKLSIAKKDK
jgi:hypothetical protein